MPVREGRGRISSAPRLVPPKNSIQPVRKLVGAGLVHEFLNTLTYYIRLIWHCVNLKGVPQCLDTARIKSFYRQVRKRELLARARKYTLPHSCPNYDLVHYLGQHRNDPSLCDECLSGTERPSLTGFGGAMASRSYDPCPLLIWTAFSLNSRPGQQYFVSKLCFQGLNLSKIRFPG